jgi:hypothetical protein
LVDANTLEEVSNALPIPLYDNTFQGLQVP